MKENNKQILKELTDRVLHQMDYVQNFTKEAALSSAASALNSANAAKEANRTREFAEECTRKVEESQNLLNKLNFRSWIQLILALVTCIGIMFSVSFFINSSNARLIQAYKESSETEVQTQNKNQERLENELNSLRNVLQSISTKR